MKTLLLILGKETNEFAKGNYNKSLFVIGRRCIATDA